MELNELKKDAKIIGKAKEITKVRQGKSKKSGKAYIAYNLIVMVENKAKGIVDEIKVEFFSMEGNAPNKSQLKFFEEGKTVVADGYDNADIVDIVGNLSFNEYVSKSSNKYVFFNSLNGVFIHRLGEEGKDTKHKAVANVETVITDISDKLNEEDLPTGEKVLQGFTIGYSEEIIPIKDAIVPGVLAESFSKVYKPNQTATLTYQFVNRAIVEDDSQEPDEEEEVIPAFGSVADIETKGKVFTKYDTRTLLVGGLKPYDDDFALSQDEIDYAKELRTKKETEVKNTVPMSASDYPEPPKDETPKQTGFGSDDIPDF